MSDTPTEQDKPRRSGAPSKPYPRTVGGFLVWIGVAVLFSGLVALDVYRKARRFKGKSHQWAVAEARATIPQLRARQETYRAKHGVYLSTITRGEDDFYPARGSEPQRRRFQPLIDQRPAWALLTSAMPKTQLWCGYVIVAGPGGSLAKAGPRGKTLFGNRPPPNPWYYIRARCIQGEGKVLKFESTSTSKWVVFRN
jgi:hypothetical protein